MIERASNIEFQPFFNTYINPDAHVVTDEWTGYKPLKKKYPLLEQVPSEKGKGLKELHIHIMNIQSWLRGIYHHCTKERLQGYLDEYHFRYNRRAIMEDIFDLIIKRMIEYKPIRLKNNNINRDASTPNPKNEKLSTLSVSVQTQLGKRLSFQKTSLAELTLKQQLCFY